MVIAVLVSLLVITLALLFFTLRAFFFQSESPAPVGADTPQASTSSHGADTPILPYSPLDSACFGEENGHRYYRSDTLEAKYGLDIASHQGWIDWEAVADSDVDFVIIRAGYRGYTDGSINQDSYLEYNLETASATDLGIGLYFFSQAVNPQEAAAEAHTVLSMIEGYEIDYPIYFDWEPVFEEGSRTATFSGMQITACAKEFCRIIEEAGYRAGVYFNLSQATSYYNLEVIKDYSFWLAEYQPAPSFPYAIDIWQYSNEGTTPGISTTVDANLCFTSFEK